MAGLKKIDGYKDFVVNICPDGTEGEVIELSDVFIQLPKKPLAKDILFNGLKREEQMWKRLPVPQDLMRIRSMDEWMEQPKEFRVKHAEFIDQEFHRRRSGVWFYNNGVPTYITGHHYMLLQWSQMDIGYASYLDFQRKLYLHFEACKQDPRCVGQIYTNPRLVRTHRRTSL